MNLDRVAGLARTQLQRSTWYRATLGARKPFEFDHTSRTTTRFSSANAQYFLLYLAADPITALLEVEAVVATHNPPQTHYIRPNAYTVWPISVALGNVVDFGDPHCRSVVETSAQELTGDWRTELPVAGGPPAVRSIVSEAPTQQLGAALDNLDSEGFLAPSAKAPTISNLVVFPHRVDISASQLRIASR